ncbi:immunoglobulin lambda-1 light chain-like [Pagrus major]|uniref:immunoglobulin lambda-1 light chain-like n=1 Tax=Pagrus major TaxID=143350 RepID=UPI003CC8848C
MAAQLIQDDLTLTRRVDGDVSFSCRTDQCRYNSRFHPEWYQKKDTGTFTRILYFDKNSCNIEHRDNHPQKNDFSVVKNQNGCQLKIQKVKLLHSATYYCYCQKRWWSTYYYLAFLSGTKLFVTEQVVKPVVSVYPAASRAHLEGKSSLLCVASAMSPPLVRFSWNRRKENEEKWLPAEGEQLELRKSGCIATILPLDQDALNTYEYRCSVQHEGGTVEAQIEQAAVQTTSSSTTTSSKPPTSSEMQPEAAASKTTSSITTSSKSPTSSETQPEAVSFQFQCRVKLLCVLYTVLIVKSLVYCCGLSRLMSL